MGQIHSEQFQIRQQDESIVHAEISTSLGIIVVVIIILIGSVAVPQFVGVIFYYFEEIMIARRTYFRTKSRFKGGSIIRSRDPKLLLNVSRKKVRNSFILRGRSDKKKICYLLNRALSSY